MLLESLVLNVFLHHWPCPTCSLLLSPECSTLKCALLNNSVKTSTIEVKGCMGKNWETLFINKMRALRQPWFWWFPKTTSTEGSQASACTASLVALAYYDSWWQRLISVRGTKSPIRQSFIPPWNKIELTGQGSSRGLRLLGLKLPHNTSSQSTSVLEFCNQHLSLWDRPSVGSNATFIITL